MLTYLQRLYNLKRWCADRGIRVRVARTDPDYPTKPDVCSSVSYACGMLADVQRERNVYFGR